MARNAVGRIGEAGLGILGEVVALQFRGEAPAEVGRVTPGVRTGIDQAQHVGRQPQTVMQVRVPCQVEHRTAAVGTQARRAGIDRIGA